jgi:hypothetical protein
MATLLAFVRTLEASAQDDVLDLLDIIVTKVSADAAAVGKRARLRTIRDLDAAALKLRRAGAVLMTIRSTMRRSGQPPSRSCLVRHRDSPRPD